MVFYTLNPETKKYYERIIVEDNGRIIPDQESIQSVPWSFSEGKLKPIKCDIIRYFFGNHHPMVQIKMYLDNDILTGFVYYLPNFPFNLSSGSELFDGRFNMMKPSPELIVPEDCAIGYCKLDGKI